MYCILDLVSNIIDLHIQWLPPPWLLGINIDMGRPQCPPGHRGCRNREARVPQLAFAALAFAFTASKCAFASSLQVF
jgi:hypothetical protein